MGRVDRPWDIILYMFFGGEEDWQYRDLGYSFAGFLVDDIGE